MAKAAKKIAETKTAEKASTIFHKIMAASVKGNPKPKQKEITKEVTQKVLKTLQQKNER